MPHSIKLNTTIVSYTSIPREEISSLQLKQDLQFTCILSQVLSILTYPLVILHVKFPSYTLCAIMIWYRFAIQYALTPTIANTPISQLSYILLRIHHVTKLNIPPSFNPTKHSARRYHF